MLSIPLNSWYQHFNLDGTRPLRLLAATSAPLMINTLRNSQYIFTSHGVFPERYDGEPDYYTEPGKHLGEGLWETNFVPDLRSDRIVASDAIRSPKDLEGKRIAVTSRAHCVYGNLKTTLRHAGVDLERVEVSFTKTSGGRCNQVRAVSASSSSCMGAVRN